MIMIPCFFVQSTFEGLHLYLLVFIILGYDFLVAMGLHRVYIDVARYFFIFWKDIFTHLDSR